MLKERIQNGVGEMILRSLQIGKERGLKTHGKPNYDLFIEDFKKGNEIMLSSYIHILDGFEYESNISGLENIQSNSNQPALVVVNHSNEGPLRGQGQRFVINHWVNQATQIELRWLWGGDKTSLQDSIRNRMIKLTNAIPVRDDDPEKSSNLIRQALRNKDIIGINPEGKGSKTLLRGKYKAGQMLWLSALNNYNILSTASYFKNDIFFLTIAPSLENEKIKKIVKISNDKTSTFQEIVDYSMAKIAKNLPPDHRGYYQHNFQEIISRFESPQI